MTVELPERVEYWRVDRWSPRFLNWEHSGMLFDTYEQAREDFETRRVNSPHLRCRVVRVTTEVQEVWDGDTQLAWGQCETCSRPLRKLDARVCGYCRRAEKALR